MAILLPLLVGLLPLAITPRLLFHYDITPKVVMLAFGVVISLALPRQIAGGAAALWSRKPGRLLCAVAVAQVLWFAVVTAVSSRPWFSLVGSNWRRMGLLTVAALALFSVLAAAHLSRKPASARIALRSFVIATIIASAYGIAQYFNFDPFQTKSAYHAHAGNFIIVRPPSTMGHADYFGWWLAIALFCGIGTARIEVRVWRWLGVAACILCGTALPLSGTRSALLGAVAGFILLALLSGFTLSPKRLSTGLLAIGIVIVFYLSPAGTLLRARVRWSQEEPLGGVRPLLWRDSLRMAAARPLAGFGPETFAAEFPLYQSTELARQLPDFYHESPHNTALDALTEQGLPGLLLVISWAALAAYASLTAWRTGSPLSAPLASALVASCVTSMFSAVTVVPLFSTLLVIAMLVALSPAEAVPAAKPAKPARAHGRAIALTLSALIAMCLGAFAVLLTRSDFNLARFQQKIDRAPGPRIIALYNSMARTELPGAAEDLYCSRKLAATCGAVPDSAIRAQCERSATQAAARATVSADNPPNAWYNLAMIAAAQNSAAGVEASLRTAARLAPDWFKPHWALANLLALTGRDVEARTEAEKAFLLDAGKDAEVNQTLARLTRHSH